MRLGIKMPNLLACLHVVLLSLSWLNGRRLLCTNEGHVYINLQGGPRANTFDICSQIQDTTELPSCNPYPHLHLPVCYNYTYVVVTKPHCA